MKFEITKDKKYLQITECTKFELDQLNLSFTKRMENYKFHPLVKKGIWDGKIKFVQHNMFIPLGLYNEVLKWGQEYNIETLIYGIDYLNNNINKDEFYDFCIDLFENHPEITPYDYQIECAYNILNNTMSTSEIATSAGKTLIMYLTCMWMKERMNIKHILIVVPRTMLVTQGIEDFTDYNDDTKYTFTSTGIFAGSKENVENIDFVFGTYQSLVKRETELFTRIQALIIDECHGTKAKSNKTLINKCTNTIIKYGLTGTLYKDSGITDFEVQSYLGPMIQQITPKFLQDNGYATKMRIKMIYLDYLSNDEKLNLYKLRKNYTSKKKKESINIDELLELSDTNGSDIYNMEKKIITENPLRMKFITEMISKVSKSSLVLFSDIKDGYGKRIYNRLKALCNYEIMYIDGNTPDASRDYIKKQLEDTSSVKILVASFGTLSTGVSIKNLHNIFFTESYKSEIIVKQSIGRGMRLHKDKQFVNIIDFVDNFSHKKVKGTIFKHSEEREKIYLMDGYVIEKISITI